MDPEVPAPKDSQDAQDGGSVQQAVELVGKMLEQIQIELEKMLSQRGEVPPEADALENEKDESQKRYKDLESNYQKISEELKTFGRQTASAPDKSGQVQADLKLAQAKKDIEILKAEVENLEAQCNDYQAQAHQLPRNVQELQTQLEERKNQNIELQRRKVEIIDQDPDVWRRWVRRYNLMESAGPMHLWGPAYKSIVYSVQSFVLLALDLEQELKMELISQRKPRDRMLRRAFDMKPGSTERTHHLGRAIFQFLSDEIFFQPIFGLDDEDEGVKMEAGLATFEKKIRDAAEGDIHKNLDYYNWRKLTYRCGKLIRKRDSDKRIGAFALALENFLRPLPKTNYERIEEKILEMCREAFTLSQTLRAEPLESYKIFFPEPGDPIVYYDDKQKNTMEIWGQEGGHPADEVGTVAYTYFGGLAFADNHKQEWHPLATAKVVVKAEERSW